MMVETKAINRDKEECHMPSFPRILIINSQSCYNDNATGITMRSILSCLPQDRILELYRFEPQQRVAVSYDFLSLQIPPKSMPLNYIIRMITGHDNYRECNEQKGTEAGGENVVSFKDILSSSVKAVVESSEIIAPKSFLKTVDDFKPEIVYSLGGDFNTLKWVDYFSRRYSIPIVMHYMDNWRETAYTQDSRLFWLNRKLQKQLYNLENRMTVGMTISQYMADAYSTKYGHKYCALMHTVSPFSMSPIEHDCIHLVYAGGLHLNRYKTLLTISNAISGMQDIKLFIYTSKHNRETFSGEFKASNTFFMNSVPHNRITEVYENADILLHVESFNEKIIEFTKYSLSTKIPEYLISGKPIICYAPDCIASYKCIVNSRAGIGVSSTGELINAIDLLKDENRRTQFGDAGKAYAEEHFSDEALVNVLQMVFLPSNYK